MQGENSLFDDFTVELTDADNDMTSSTLSVNIIDDLPTARPDADIVVAEDAANVGGNLLDDDPQSADGATVTSVTIGGTTTANHAVGDYLIPTQNSGHTFNATDVWTFPPQPVDTTPADEPRYTRHIPTA